jgi:hypothetical protein
VIVGLVGVAGSGKDEVGRILVTHHGFASLALADPMKEICRDIFGWDDDMLWGPSGLRSSPDKRSDVYTCDDCGWYGQKDQLTEGPMSVGPQHLTMRCCPHCGGVGVVSHPLSPRIALQTLGTEWGRALYPEIWTALALQRAEKLLKCASWIGDVPVPIINVPFPNGIRKPAPQHIHGQRLTGVAITDVRFINEARAIRAHGGKLVHILRNLENKAQTGIREHVSEMEQATIPDSWYDFTIRNDGTLKELTQNVAVVADQLKGET